ELQRLLHRLAHPLPPQELEGVQLEVVLDPDLDAELLRARFGLRFGDQHGLSTDTAEAARATWLARMPARRRGRGRAHGPNPRKWKTATSSTHPGRTSGVMARSARRSNVQGLRQTTNRSLTPEHEVALKVMSFNLRRDKESDGANGWSSRRDAAAVVARHHPDLLGTQEGLQDQIDFLHQHFPEYGVLGEARFGGRRDEYNAIFYRKAKFKVEATGIFWLSETPHVPGSRHWGNLVPRMATWATFVDK